MQLLCKPVCQSLLVMFLPAIPLEPNLTKRRIDMQSCVCPALVRWVHCKFNLSTRHQRSPTSGRFPSIGFHPATYFLSP